MTAALIFTGCGTNSNTADTDNSAEEIPVLNSTHSDDGITMVGISMPDKLLERWNTDGSFLRSKFENLDYEVTLRFADNLIDKQINDLREMIINGADLLVISAVDGAALGHVLEEAHASNVTVISYDRLLMDSEYVDYYVSFDNYMVGQLQAEYIIDKLDLDNTEEVKHLEVVSGDSVDNNARYFYNGAMDMLKPYIESGKLETMSGQTGFYETSTSQWSTDLAEQKVRILINSYYFGDNCLDALLCANDSTALGASKAVTEEYDKENPVLITGQDADVANIYNIFDGIQSMTVYKALDQESVVTAYLAEYILDENTPNEEMIKLADWDFECRYSTSDYNNGKKNVTSFLLTPISIDKENIEAELFDKGHYAYSSTGLIYVVK